VKFLYSDTQDYVDPDFDFLTDSMSPSRERYWHDKYAHELMEPTPYDGLLVSMSAIRQAKGVASSKVRYSTAEEQRLLRIGARRFLRFDGPKHRDLMLMGDCGAFAYVNSPKPAYTPKEVVEFYTDAEFTHGVSPDHVIFDCDITNPSKSSMSKDVVFRYEITLENARTFLRLTEQEGFPFEPMGAVQGWSPESMANAAQALIDMGYKYLAIGGLVPLNVPTIKNVLQTIREKIGFEAKMHLLGFAKADHIDEFTGYGITSFDSTSPLIRAFKDERSNYYVDNKRGGLNYYTAIRIPQSMDNSRLMQGIKRGLFHAEDLQAREQRALSLLRAFDKNRSSCEETLEAIMDYSQFLVRGDGKSTALQDKQLATLRTRIAHTLEDRPWQSCGCDICRTAGVEVVIFRGSNRNKRRGFHNLGVYHQHVQRILDKNS